MNPRYIGEDSKHEKFCQTVNMRILLVQSATDDLKEVSDLISSIDSVQTQLLCSKDSAEAVEKLKDSEFDLIIAGNKSTDDDKAFGTLRSEAAATPLLIAPDDSSSEGFLQIIDSFVNNLVQRNELLEIKLKHLKNELLLTKEEYDNAACKYLEIYSNLEKIVDERTKMLQVEISERKKLEGTLQKLNLDLEQRVQDRTQELMDEISERKRVANALRDSEERLELALLGGNLALWDLNLLNGNFFFNQRWTEIFGFENSSAKFKHIEFWRDLYHPEDKTEEENVRNAHLNGDSPFYQHEFRVRYTDDSYKWISVRGKVVQWSNSGQALRMSGTAMDVTERKKFEEEAEQQRQQLVQADKMVALGILVAGVAHEINNPTNFIAINISLLRKIFNQISSLLIEAAEDRDLTSIAGVSVTKLESTFTDLISGVDEGAMRIRDIVNNLKDYARKRPIDMSGLVDINLALKNSLLLLANLIKRSTNNFSVEYGEHLPTANGDIRRIEQVVINVVQNACQALPDKEKALRIKTYFQEEKQSLIMEITDEGKGISDEDIKHMMDPFFTTKRDEGGTGLGLSVSSGIIKEHRGILEVKSKIDIGTTIRIVLPVAAKQG